MVFQINQNFIFFGKFETPKFCYLGKKITFIFLFYFKLINILKKMNNY